MIKLTDAEIQNIIALYDTKSLVQIAKQYNFSRDVLKRIFKQNNIPIKNFTEIRSKVKKNPFLDLKNPETQYWLGWLATDGSIFRYTIKLSLIDLDIIQNFSRFCNNTSIRKNIPKNIKHSTIYSTEFSNKYICQYLEELGISKNKTYTLELKIPITWDLLLGVIEGDGWVYNYKNSTRKTVGIGTASFLFINQIKTFLESYNVKCNIHIRKTNGINKKGVLYVLTVNKKESIQIMKENLYKNTFSILNRKII